MKRYSMDNTGVPEEDETGDWVLAEVAENKAYLLKEDISALEEQLASAEEYIEYLQGQLL